jgi:hypothetical protein
MQSTAQARRYTRAGLTIFAMQHGLQPGPGQPSAPKID